MIVGGMFPSKNWWGVLYKVVHTFKNHKKNFGKKILDSGNKIHLLPTYRNKKPNLLAGLKSMSNLKKKSNQKKNYIFMAIILSES